jgi:transcription elongation GreA/GreB family factor
MPKVFTPEGLEKLKNELGVLKIEKRKEIAERLKKLWRFIGER